MKLLTAKWCKHSELASIKFTDEFNYGADWLIKADALQDLIGILNREYDNLMSIEDWDERNEYILQGEYDARLG